MSEETFVPDRLMWYHVKVDEPDIRYYNAAEAPFRVYGLCKGKDGSAFQRLPDEVGQNVNRGVAMLYKNTAGGRVRFSTDSDYVVIRAYMSCISKNNHMCLLGGAGFDLYEDDPASGRSHFVAPFLPPKEMTEGYVSIVRFSSQKRLRYLTINFPTYSNVERLEIGLQENATLGEGMAYSNQKPIVFYGSSITQGGCASRPGNNYISLACRRLNADYVNLGFSGSGTAEDSIVEHMASLEMSCFVSDYDHNAPDASHLAKTHRKMYQTIRQAHPAIPYVMMSRPDFGVREKAEESRKRRDAILDTFRYAREAGDKNVYFIDGETFFQGPWEDACTVDGTHPNDLGFMYMAQKVYDVLAKLGF